MLLWCSGLSMEQFSPSPVTFAGYLGVRYLLLYIVFWGGLFLSPLCLVRSLGWGLVVRGGLTQLVASLGVPPLHWGTSTNQDLKKVGRNRSV